MRMVLRAASLLPLIWALPAGAVDMPPRKPGLWEASVTTTIAGQTSSPQVSQQCIDAETDTAMRALDSGLLQAKCQRRDLRREGNSLVLDAECRAGDTAIGARGVSSGNFDSDYITTLTLTRLGTPAFPTIPPEMTITRTVRWIGACRADQKPGDMVLPNGARMNIRNVPGAADLLPPPAASPADSPATVMPARKPGLWEIRSRFVDDVLPASVEKLCISPEIDREINTFANNAPGAVCTQRLERAGDSYVTAGKCVSAGRTMLARSTIVGDFQTALTSEITMNREDGQPIGPGLPNELVVRQDWRWLTACSADMRGGDILLPDGTRKHFRDLR